MAEKNLNGSGLNEVWVRAAQLVKRFTGAVNLTKGDLQTQVDTKVEGKAISSSSAITNEGQYALDAREKNASVEGTLANQISNLNSNFDTKADKTQISNPNLLDNAWFNVNSRGQNEYVGGYIVDRWKASYFGGEKVFITENGISINSTISSNTNRLTQIIPILKPGKYTVSFCLEKNIGDKKLNALFRVNNEYFNIAIFDNVTGILSSSFEISEELKNVQFIFQKTGLCEIDIRAVKLELGSVSTLHMDTAPDIEQERLKCMLSTADTTDTYANKGALSDDIWNSTKTYSVGEYCIYNGSLWKCLVENSNTVPVEGDTWTATSISAELASIISKIDALSS